MLEPNGSWNNSKKGYVLHLILFTICLLSSIAQFVDDPSRPWSLIAMSCCMGGVGYSSYKIYKKNK